MDYTALTTLEVADILHKEPGETVTDVELLEAGQTADDIAYLIANESIAEA